MKVPPIGPVLILLLIGPTLGPFSKWFTQLRVILVYTYLNAHSSSDY